MTSPRWWAESSGPLPVEGGLKARSTRGEIARTWWSGRFIAVIASIIVGGRLDRGRNYARRGQVVSLDVVPGMASALVQGSDVRPYRIRVGLATYGAPEWARIERALAESAWYSAKLLAGEMPEDIEELFGDLGLALFPTSAADLAMDCSCPDYQVPCKHIAAVFYLLAESFDEDPFRILAWRGREREELLANVHAARAAGAPTVAGPDTGAGVGGPAEGPARVGAPLAECLGSYFALQAPLPVPVPAATSSAALLDQLPPVAIAVREQMLTELLRPAYESLGERGPGLVDDAEGHVDAGHGLGG